MVGRHQMAAVIIMAIGLGVGLLACRRHLRIQEELVVPLGTAGVVLGVVPEFDRSPPGAIQPDGKPLVIQLK